MQRHKLIKLLSPTVVIGKATIMNCDCMEYMATLPDKAFDLAIVDPPYGIGAGKKSFQSGTRKSHNHANKNWDASIPTDDYWAELLRVSKNQIIWGANYYANKLPTSRGWIYWHKMVLTDNYSQGELAWTSFDSVLKYFQYKYQGNYIGFENNITTQTATPLEARIHPTQKPIALYEWLLTNYAKPGQRILDTHLGSGSHAIACNNLGFELVACELDTDYYNASIERIKKANSVGKLFTPEQVYKSRKRG